MHNSAIANLFLKSKNKIKIEVEIFIFIFYSIQIVLFHTTCNIIMNARQNPTCKVALAFYGIFEGQKYGLYADCVTIELI